MIAIQDINNKASAFYNDTYIPDNNYQSILGTHKLLGFS